MKPTLTDLLITLITTGLLPFAIPAGQAKLEEIRARAKAAAHDLAMRYAREAVRWAENEGRRLRIEGDELERLAMQHLRDACKGVKALLTWGEADLLGVLRAAFEEWRLEVKRFDADVAELTKKKNAALARLRRAGAAADKLNAERTPSDDEPTDPGAGGEP